MFKFFVFLVLATSTVLGIPSRKLRGRYLPGGRIVGGEDADIADYPYQLCLLYEGSEPFCGATLISDEWALTAAHCVNDIEPEYISVRAGSSISTSGGQVVNVEKVYQHKDFSFTIGENDIALLKLSSKITAANAKVIGLSTSTPKADEVATITGWGITDDDYDSVAPEVLQVVQVPIVGQADCRKAYGEDGIADTMICAGLLDVGGKDACEGDSGGPLVVNGVVAGIVSWGAGCAQPNAPGVYTDVASFLDWIEEQRSSD